MKFKDTRLVIFLIRVLCAKLWFIKTECVNYLKNKKKSNSSLYKGKDSLKNLIIWKRNWQNLNCSKEIKWI